MGDDTMPDGGSVRLVGTAHVSAESAAEVERAVREDSPDVVAVELDEGRYRQMRGDARDDLDPADLLQGSVAVQLLAYWLLSYVQARLGERFDIEPGADMRAGIETAEEVGADVALVDRDIQVTIQRFWARMTAVEKLQLVGGLLFGATGSLVAGVTGGLLLGFLLGPLVGLLSPLAGVTEATMVSVTAGGLVGAAAAAVTGSLLDGVHPFQRLLLAAATGVAVGGLAGPLLGLADPLVAGVLSGLPLRIAGGLVLGVTGGLALGAVAGTVLTAVSESPSTEDLDDELDLEDITDGDVVAAMLEEFRKFSPGGAEALIFERDAYIAHELRELTAQGKQVVAVVGAGHEAGIREYLANPDSLPPKASLEGAVSRGVPWTKLLGLLLSLGFLVFFGLLVMAEVPTAVLLRVAGAWILFNGAAAFLLAKLGGAHWTSATVGGLVAWLTSLNPLLAPGWFAGYVELRYLSVRISDIGTLNEIMSDESAPVGELFDRMREVPLFRLIAVVALTNLGSMVASFLFPVVVLPLLGGPFDSVPELLDQLRIGLENTLDLLAP